MLLGSGWRAPLSWCNLRPRCLSSSCWIHNKATVNLWIWRMPYVDEKQIFVIIWLFIIKLINLIEHNKAKIRSTEVWNNIILSSGLLSVPSPVICHQLLMVDSHISCFLFVESCCILSSNYLTVQAKCEQMLWLKESSFCVKCCTMKRCQWLWFK